MADAWKGRNEDPLWYKDAIIYQLHVKTFFDGNGDGIGDFPGLTSRLDYLRELGVTALWLLPFYPSPLKDDGYDIADFKGIHPAYGTLSDFRTFLREAHRREMRVITELVINHTSDRHPWFQRARRAKPGSPWRDFYVWSDTDTKYGEARVFFQEFKSSNWTWDPLAGAFYWHRFYPHQPDLNFRNPRVHEAVFRVLDFWMEMGVDGLRLDAIPYLYEREGTSCENLPETHDFLKKLRERLDVKYDGRMFLAEANQWPEDAVRYFGQGDECHMCFHFPLMPRLYMALHMENRYPVTEILAATPPIPESCQWALFLRNHDELTLEMVTEEEREYMYRAYGWSPEMRVNLGIRRRLAPLMGNHRRRIELMNALLLSLPGTPVIYYGDEIGMGDNVYLGDRNGVRTPMQWSPDRNAGFSGCNPQQLFLPVIIDPEYHYEVINVEAQKKNRHSLFWWMRRLITLRRRLAAFSRGEMIMLEPENPRILAFIRKWGEQSILVVANLSRFVQFAALDLSSFRDSVPVEVFGNTPFPRISGDPCFLTLSPHAFYWFRLSREEGTALPEGAEDSCPVFDVRKEWMELFPAGERMSPALESRLASYIGSRPWFGPGGRRIKSLAVSEAVPARSDGASGVILFVDLVHEEGGEETCVLPLAWVPASEWGTPPREIPSRVLARVRRSGGEEGVLVDGVERSDFCLMLLKMILRRQGAKGRWGRLKGWRSPGVREEELPPGVPAARTAGNNTSVAYGNSFVLKLFRRLQDGMNPELEMGRFLTERGFHGIPSLEGALEYLRPGSEPRTAAVLHVHVQSRGSAWEHALHALSSYFEKIMERREFPMSSLRGGGSPSGRDFPGIPADGAEGLGSYLQSVRILADRTAEMHLVLASERRDALFAPEPFSRLYQRSLFQSMTSMAGRVLRRLGTFLREEDVPISRAIHALGEDVQGRQEEILARFRGLTAGKINALRLRCHGDFRLERVLFTGKDFFIVDFEGSPSLPVNERRIKRSPLGDVAGMLLSFCCAVQAALSAEEARGSFHDEDRPFLEAMGEEWRRAVSSEYLRAYLEKCSSAGFLPLRGEEFRVLLDACLMEKALLALDSDMNSRGGCIHTSLTAIWRLLGEP